MSSPHITLDISSISLVLAVLGFYITFIGQFSYWLKEKLFISSALISLSVGIAVGPIGANWISPWVWTNYDDDLRNEITYQFCRLVIGIQVMFAGISLPAAYLYREWKSLAMLLIPIMTIGWFISAGFILLFVPGLTFLEALCISAAVTPTDPILANAIVKGRYAEKHVPRNVRFIISAESGANDGLGYPFIYLPILLMRRTTTIPPSTISNALQDWVVQTWIYQIFLSIFLGFLIGFVGRKTLKEAHKRQLIDHESFLAYGVGLAFLVLGVVGVLGSDDVLAAFVAGNSLTWRDFYRVENQDDTFQDTLDSLLNASIFLYVGSLIPWSEFTSSLTLLSPWRLVLLAICILIFRRLPWVMGLGLLGWIPALEDRKQAIFAGHFGPIGVSAIYYAMVALRELPAERVLLRSVIVPVVLFIVLSSTIVHGITIPLTKFAPKALTRTRSTMSLASTNANHYFNRLRGIHTTEVRVENISAPVGKAIRDSGRTAIVGSRSGSRSGSRRTSFDSDTIEGGVDEREEGREGSLRLNSLTSSVVVLEGGDVGRSILNRSSSTNSIEVAGGRVEGEEMIGVGGQMRVEFVLP